MNIRLINLFLVGFLFLGFAGASGPCEQTHGFSVDDMLAMDRISDAQVSPDNTQIVFVVRKTDMEANKGRSDLWLVNVDGTALRRLTSHPEADSNPRWSANGKSIWFISGRSGSSQLWQISLDGGEAQQFTDMPLDVGNLVVYWDTWKDGRRNHLFVMSSAGSEPINVMSEMDADTPSMPFGGPEEITFTPDGKSIIFTARDVGKKESWSTDFDLYKVPIDGTAEPICLTAENQAWDCNPMFSPDGKMMAYLAMSRPGYESDRNRIILCSMDEGHKHVLTENWDRSASSICFSDDGGTIYTTAANIGQKSLFAINVKTGNVRCLVKEGYVSSVAAAGERIVYGMNNLKSPVELYSIKAGGGDVRAITAINAEKIAKAKMGEYEQFSFKGWNDEKVYCYVVKPADFEKGKKYPVAFLIHGGPQGSFGNHFHYRWNPQAYAGAGYAVVMVDFHGSTGYGQGFTDSIRGDWGGKPFEDLQKGLAAALKRYKWMDGQRVGALGASFGGYMINWAAGNWPDRFKCMVNHDGNLDERMAYFDTEELWFPEWDHLGTPWDNPEGYEKHNPVNHVKNWKTPMLVVHGAMDFRVVDTQGIATFNVLQRLGIESKLLYFPDEGHWVLKPHNSILWHKTVIAWLDRWLKN